MTTFALPRRPGDQSLAVLALLATTALWATSFVAAKIALAAFPPATLVLLRCAVAYAVVRPFSGRVGPAPAPARRWNLLLGLTGIAFPVFCHNLALRWTSTADASLIYNGSLPVLTLLLARSVLGERLGGRPLLGLAASLTGVAAVAGTGGARLADATVGSGLVLAGTAAFAVYTVAGRRALAGSVSQARLTGTLLAALLLLLPFAASEVVAGGPPRPSAPALLALLYLGGGCTGLALWLNAVALRRLEAGRVAVIGNLEVPLGLASAALVLGEPVGGPQLAGTALIVGGAWLASRDSRSAADRTELDPTATAGRLPLLDLAAVVRVRGRVRAAGPALLD
jgi:drug/metabolite transporter (DMT)-like permease